MEDVQQTCLSMYIRTWLEHTAIGLIVLAVVGLALGIGELVRERPIRPTSRNCDQDKAGCVDPKAPNGRVTVTVRSAPFRKYEPNCADRQDADLCAQFRMAEAAEIQTSYTRWGFILLSGTLIAAIWAAWEARKSAKAGWKTVEVTEHAAQQQLRAYISLFGGELLSIAVPIL